MAKCIRCGKGLGLKAKVKLVDGILCRNCFHELGFSGFDASLAKDYYKWDLIKNGKEAYNEYNRKLNEDFRAANPGLMEALSDDKPEEKLSDEDVEVIVTSGLQISNYGQKREVNATDGEREIFECLCRLFPDETLHLCRKSDDYVTAMRGEWDVVRFKYSDRAKWITLPILERPKKNYIEQPSDVEEYAAKIQEGIEFIKKAQN